MFRQLTLMDIAPEMKPEYPRCYKTCIHFTNVFPSGAKDYYPCTREARCIHIELKSELIDNRWHSWCKRYEV